MRGIRMKVFIGNTDITQEIINCADREEVAFLYESVKTDTPIGEETLEHRKQLNEKLFDIMLDVHSNKLKTDTPSFHYLKP